MKKFIALALCASMTAAMFAGCSSSTTETTAAATETTAAATEAGTTAAAEDTTAAASGEKSDFSGLTTVTEGKLTVATSPDFAPYEFYSIDASGNATLAGFDMALAQYIADYLGLELEVVTVDFDGVLAELNTQSVDLGMAGLSPSEERKSAMNFSDIYYQGGQEFVTTTQFQDTITSMEVANDAQYTIGAQTGSIQETLAKENTPNATLVSMPKVTDIIAELLTGKEQAAFIEKDVALCYQKNYPDLVMVEDVPYDTTGSSIGVNKSNDALLDAVNEAIAAAISDGSLNQFVADANEAATGEKYEGLLEDGKVPGSN